MGEYIFFVDLVLPSDGAHPLALALDQLRPLCEHLALFGTYPVDTVPLDTMPLDEPAATEAPAAVDSGVSGT
jgi:hypothetical protein